MPYRQPFSIPAEIDPPRVCLQINIPDTDDHRQVLAGLLWELTQWWNWQRDNVQSGRQLAAVYRDVFLSIDWSAMSCCPENMIVLRRVDPENGALIQISIDGGNTWTVDPDNPSITATELPPITMDDHHTKCDAASNALQHIKDLVAKQVDENASGAVLITVCVDIAIFIAGLLLVVFTEGGALPVVVPVLVSVVGAVLALSGTTFADYFTSDIYDIVLCALYCHIEEDGTFSDEDWANVVVDLSSNMPAGTPQADWLIQMVKVMGARGLNTIAAYGESADADCSACDCGLPCDIDNWSVYIGTEVSRDAGTGHIIVAAVLDGATFGGYGIILQSSGNGLCCHILPSAVIGSYGTVLKIDCGGDAYPTGTFSGGGGTDLLRSILLASSTPFTADFLLDP